MNPEHKRGAAAPPRPGGLWPSPALAGDPVSPPARIAVQRLYRTEAVTALQRDAARAGGSGARHHSRRPVSLRPVPSQPVIGVYDTAAGAWRARARPVRFLAASGQKTQCATRSTGGDLAVIAPIRPTRRRSGRSGRPSVPDVTDRVHRAWAAMALLALIATALAAVLAGGSRAPGRRRSNGLTAPPGPRRR